MLKRVGLALAVVIGDGSMLACLAKQVDGRAIDGGPDAGPGAGPDAGPDDAGCVYPAGDAGFGLGQVIPDLPLGIGFVNFDAGSDAREGDAGLVSAADLLLQLHCSGKRYVLIDLSTVWCPLSGSLASQLPAHVPGWLDAGGLVMTALEQGSQPSPDGDYPAATADDLLAWIAMFKTNYSLVNDPTQGLHMAAGNLAWPSTIIVELSTMQVVDSAYGADNVFLDEYTALLASTPDGG
jgi:hypothetical protein